MNKNMFFTLLVFLIFSINSFAQDDWLQSWRDATVAIGIIDSSEAINTETGEIILDSKGDTLIIQYFKVVGTGIIFANPDTSDTRPYLVTAKHVFNDPKKNWEPSKIMLRFSWFSDLSVTEYYGVEVTLKIKIKTYGYSIQTNKLISLFYLLTFQFMKLVEIPLYR